ncbi:MAG: hypothetical protein B6I20_09115 [Bacteroidetes bacterium 4572_117]|nr:MAG: hypothetical protein B6I20_09115 [Bacteroidetes bacterium 4572_117]
MGVLFKTADTVISSINEFLDAIDQGALVFKQGVNNYLNKETKEFSDNIETILKLESHADKIRKQIENDLYIYSLLPQFRGDVMVLLEKLDDIIDTAKEIILQFDVEGPNIPIELNNDFSKLTDASVLSVESLIPAVRAYFNDVNAVKDRLHRVYYYEKESDKLADNIKRRLFKELENLKLSEKIHLRYFALHVENLSDVAQEVADLLSIMAIKRSL